MADQSPKIQATASSPALTHPTHIEEVNKLLTELKTRTSYALSVKYEGEYKDGLKHGFGVCTWPDGHRYEGEWMNDKQHGYGTVIWKSGAMYEGDWVNGLRHGKGVYTWTDGERYEGEWRFDKLHGRGKYTWINGDTYEGEWKEDKRHGKGVFLQATGEKYDGDWYEDKQEGFGEFYWTDGRKYKGGFHDDHPHGHGVYTDVDGLRMEGEWREGLKYGRFICWRPKPVDKGTSSDCNTDDVFSLNSNAHRFLQWYHADTLIKQRDLLCNWSAVAVGKWLEELCPDAFRDNTTQLRIAYTSTASNDSEAVELTGRDLAMITPAWLKKLGFENPRDIKRIMEEVTALKMEEEGVDKTPTQPAKGGPSGLARLAGLKTYLAVGAGMFAVAVMGFIAVAMMRRTRLT